MTEDSQFNTSLKNEQPTAARRSYGDLVGQVVGHYLVDQRLGGGATASVYRATDQILDRTVALKVLLPNADDTARLRFRREARTVSKLIHPHIVRTLQVGQMAEDGLAYIAMDLVEGESFASLLERVRQLNLQEAAQLLAPMAQALAYAHKQGVIHRDVKPSNILLRRVEKNAPHSVYLSAVNASYVPLLSDFGIARALDAPELTNIGRTIGTPAYMSPEQCAGSREVDGRADIYSLGAVLYRALVGRPPFTGTTTQILHAHVYEPLTIPEDIVNDLSPNALDILRRSLIKEPNQRYSHVELMVHDLVNVAGTPERAPTTTGLEAVKPPNRFVNAGAASPYAPPSSQLSNQPSNSPDNLPSGLPGSLPARGERTTSQQTIYPSAPTPFGRPTTDNVPSVRPLNQPPTRPPAGRRSPRTVRGASASQRVRLGWLVGGAVSALLLLILFAMASDLLPLGNRQLEGAAETVVAEQPDGGTSAALAPPLAQDTPTPTLSPDDPASSDDGGSQSVGPAVAASTSTVAGASSAGDPPTESPTETPAPTLTATPTLSPTPTPNATPEQPLRESLALAQESYAAHNWSSTRTNAQLALRRTEEYEALPSDEQALLQEMLFVANVGRAAQLNAGGEQPLAAARLREALALRSNEPLVTNLLSATVNLAEAPVLVVADGDGAPDEQPGSGETNRDENGDGAESDAAEEAESPAEIIAERRQALQVAYVDYATALAEAEVYCLAAEQMTTALALSPDSSTADDVPVTVSLPLTEEATRYELRCAEADQVTDLDNLLADMRGTLIYSTQELNRGAYNIYTLPAAQNAPSTLVVRNGTQPAASPNGQYVAFHSTAPGEAGVYSFDLTDPALNPNSRSRQFSDNPQDGASGRIAWDNSGSLILAYTTVVRSDTPQIDRAFILSEETQRFRYYNIAVGKDPAWHPALPQLVYSGDYGSQGQGLFLRPADVGQRGAQLTSSVTDQRPDWTPDGRYVVFMRQVNSNWDIWRVDVQNPRNVLQLTDAAAKDGLPAVSPDGQLVAFASDRGGEWRIWVMTIDGEIVDSEARPLANVQGVLYNWLEHHLDWYTSP